MSAQPYSINEKIKQVLSRVGKFAGEDVQQLFNQVISPSSLEVIGATVVVWGISQLFGVGEVADIVMLAVGAAALGKNGMDFASDLALACTKTLNARTEPDLDEAAEYLGKAVVEGGVEVVMALLLRKDLGEIKIKLNAVRHMKPGLVSVGTVPAVKPKIQFTKSLGNGAQKGWVRGATDEYGSIRIAREGYAVTTQAGNQVAQWVKFTSDQKMEVILHELVHSYFSPKFAPLRAFRAALGVSGYKQLYLLRYLEEAMAQGYARTRSQGLVGVWEGIRFPVQSGYVSISDFGASAGYVGAVFLGRLYVQGRATEVSLSHGHTSSSAAAEYRWKASTRQ